MSDNDVHGVFGEHVQVSRGYLALQGNEQSGFGVAVLTVETHDGPTVSVFLPAEEATRIGWDLLRTAAAVTVEEEN